MQKRKLGGPILRYPHSELDVGLIFGFGPATEKNEAINVIRTAYDCGVTFFDTAETYGPFTNEQLIGEALAPVRDKVVIATKFGFKNGIPSQGTDSKPGRIRDVAEAALNPLDTDVIDLFYQHRVDPNTDRRRCWYREGPHPGGQGQALRYVSQVRGITGSSRASISLKSYEQSRDAAKA